MKKVVVFGGGHGQALILKGLKDIKNIELSAIVTVADDGGSTGRLRQRYSIPAMGDIRNLLLALKNKDSLLSSLMAYRFAGEEEVDVEGHSLGNLILTALTEIKGSFIESIDILAKELGVRGKIIPSTLETISLYALMDDETIVKGEANIPSFNHHIKKVFYDHDVKANISALKAIAEADLIIYGIGSIYTSILPNIIIKEISLALAKSHALKVYFANCMTQSNETFDYDLKDHVSALEYHGAKVDLVIKHQEKIPLEVLKAYQKENSFEVQLKKPLSQTVLAYDLLDFKDNLVRHSPSKIKEVVIDLLRR